jgi:outer membrane protein assembly factor BamB
VVVYLTSASGTFYALDANTGTLLSRHSMGAASSSCPTVANGEVYASGFDGGYAQLLAFRSERAVPLNPSGPRQPKTLNRMHGRDGSPRSEAESK